MKATAYLNTCLNEARFHHILRNIRYDTSVSLSLPASLRFAWINLVKACSLITLRMIIT